MEGWKSEGFKDSRIQGFKWFAWYFFSKHKSEGGEAEGRRQRTEVRGQRAESSTTLLFPQVAEPVEESVNPEEAMVPR